MRLPVLFALALAALPARATDVTLIGIFPGKAVITVNRGVPRTIATGERTAEGVLLVSTGHDQAVLEIDGVKQTLDMGQHFETAAASEGSGPQHVTLARDSNGHFMTDAQVNGGHVRFMVDTGATLVSLPLADAQRLGIDFTKGRLSYSIVADGRRVPSWRVTLDTVTVGDVTVYNVEGNVTQGNGLPLLGMSFLSRMEMRNDGQNLVLTKRY
ncbi:MAG TPA: TIGR02281 family clan AA aspartic protease [Usitatibacter sp.]|nr:TIGR02281 family clan AA aspartic protease [Usitatibacter sp.]